MSLMASVAYKCPDILGQSYKCRGVTWCPEDPMRDIPANWGYISLIIIIIIIMTHTNKRCKGGGGGDTVISSQNWSLSKPVSNVCMGNRPVWQVTRFSSPLSKNVVNHLIQTVDLKASVLCVTASCSAQEPDMSEFIWNTNWHSVSDSCSLWS